MRGNAFITVRRYMILVTGGTGFVGSHIVSRLTSGGEKVRVLARSWVDMPGADMVQGDVRDLSAVVQAARGCDAVIHLVGIIREMGDQTFRRVHVDGTRTVIQACHEAGVPRLLHMSALGARPAARSEYHRTKWEAEELVRGSGFPATIFRPSVIFGPGGGFIAEVRKLLRQGSVIPIIGGGTSLLQPVWVEDVASCFVSALRESQTSGQAYELGGPEAFGFEELVDLVAEADGVTKPKIHFSPKLIGPAAAVLGRVWRRFPITSDQLRMLLEDSVCDITAMVQTFGIEPASLRDHLND